MKHPPPLHSSAVLLEQPAPDPGAFFPAKHSQKHQNSPSILVQLEKAQLITYCVKFIGQVEEVFTRRWTDGNLSPYTLHFGHQLITKHFVRLWVPHESPCGLFFFLIYGTLVVDTGKVPGGTTLLLSNPDGMATKINDGQ